MHRERINNICDSEEPIEQISNESRMMGTTMIKFRRFDIEKQGEAGQKHGKT